MPCREHPANWTAMAGAGHGWHLASTARPLPSGHPGLSDVTDGAQGWWMETQMGEMLGKGDSFRLASREVEEECLRFRRYQRTTTPHPHAQIPGKPCEIWRQEQPVRWGDSQYCPPSLPSFQAAAGPACWASRLLEGLSVDRAVEKERAGRDFKVCGPSSHPQSNKGHFLETMTTGSDSIHAQCTPNNVLAPWVLNSSLYSRNFNKNSQVTLGPHGKP